MGGEKYLTDHPHGAKKHGNRCLQQDCSDAPAENNHQGRSVGQGTNLSAFEPVATNDGRERYRDSEQTEGVHA
jgi:hypothetical protein